MYLSPAQAQEKYGYHPKTLADWADDGKIEYIRSKGGHRRYLESSIVGKPGLPETTGLVIIYARVSTHSQKNDLETQAIALKTNRQGDLIREIGSGMNFKRKKFIKLMERVGRGEISEIVVALLTNRSALEYHCEMLKRQQGYSIATKSVKAKLIRSKFDMQETKDAYNEIVHFYFRLITENPQGVSIPVQSGGSWRFYELLTAGHQFISGFPSPLKRAAIRQAIGAYESWNSTYQKWLNRPKRIKHHKPPVHPRAFRFNPQYDSGMWKEDNGFSMILKMRVGDSWKWVKHQYQCPRVPTEWVKGSPRIQVQNGSLWLVFPLEKYVPATGGIKGIMSKDAFRTCGIDMDLDKYIVIATILETNDRGETTEIARHLINQSRHVARRKRDLGRIAIKMRQTKIVSCGFAKSKWDSITGREIDFSRTVSRELVEFARYWKVGVISFEHLDNLRPKKGKFSRRSNQKRAYWLKGKVFEQVKRIAYQDYAILTTRVSPMNTSRLSPWGEPLWRGSEFPSSPLEFEGYQPGAALVATVDGYKAHSGLNAARNVALKAIKRHLPQVALNLKSLK